MWFFLEKRKIEKQKKLEQACCPHEFYEVNRNKVYDMYADHLRTDYDIYCPICDLTKEDVKGWKWNQIKNAQEIRNAYTDKMEANQ